MQCIIKDCKKKVNYEGLDLDLCNKHLMEWFVSAEENHRENKTVIMNWWRLLMNWSVSIHGLAKQAIEMTKLAKKPKDKETLEEISFWAKFDSVGTELKASVEGLKANEEAIQSNIKALEEEL